MITNLITSFRESLEAVLIVGIILSTLTQQHKEKLKSYVVLGAIGGMLVSMIGGIILFDSIHLLDSATYRQIQGFMMLVASGLVAYFVVWLAQQNKQISFSINDRIAKTSTGIGLALLAFLGILREGLELVIYTLSNLTVQATDVAIGTIVGFILAIVCGWLIFKTSIKLNVNWIFKILGLILIYIGAGLFAEGILKFIPNGSDLLEFAFLVGYGVIALIIYLRNDVKKILRI